MTDDEIRVAIAEACGWSKFNDTYRDWWRHKATNRTQLDLPDYLHSLDAMHEAEKVLTDSLEYRAYLGTICGDDFYEKKIHWSPFICHATARQRATAFVKIMNLEEKR